MPRASEKPHFPRRYAFTFIEVMFAVMIMGFGVIMIAAMLPVALRLTQQTREINAGTAVCETGFHYVETVWGSYGAEGRSSLTTGGLPATSETGTTRLVTYPAWAWDDAWASPPSEIGLLYQTLGNRVDSLRRDTAWVPFYARTGTLNPQVAFVGVRARNVPQMSVEPGAATGTPPNYLQPGQFFTSPDNCPLPVNFVLLDSSENYQAYDDNLFTDRGRVAKLEPDVIELSNPLSDATMQARIIDAAVEGAALVLINRYGQIRVLRLGAPARTDTSGMQWTLAPGYDVRVTLGFNDARTPEFIPGEEYRGYLVGRMLRDPNQAWGPGNAYVGPSQVVQTLDGKTLR